MKKKNIFNLFIFLVVFLLSSCANKNNDKITKTEEVVSTNNQETTTSIKPINYYDVSFFNPNSSLIDTITVEEGKKPIYTNIPTFDKKGYKLTFKSWDKEFSEVYSNQVYFAVYDEELINYKITYNLGDSTNDETNPTSYNIEDNNIVLKDPYSENHDFIGWYYNNELIKEIDTKLAKDITLTPKFELTEYKITYDLDGGTLENPQTEYTVIDYISIKNQPQKKGFNFVGWTGSNGEVPQKQFSCYPSELEKIENLHFVANYEPIDYSINYSNNLNLAVDMNVDLPKTYNILDENIKLNYPDFSQYGYEFDSYDITINNAYDGLTYHFDDKDEIDTSITGKVSVKFNYKPITYTIRCHYLDDDYEDIQYNVESDTFYLRKKTYDFYNFDCWTNSNSETLSSEINKGTVGNYDYYANYTPKTYNILLYSDGEKINTIEYNVTLGEIDLPKVEKAGYDFSYWTIGAVTSDYAYKGENTNVFKSDYLVDNRSDYPLTSNFTAREDTKYVIKYMVRNVDNTGYIEKEVVEKTGETGTIPTIEIKEFDGFENGHVSGEYYRIAGDGTTVYEVVYTRLKYKFITSKNIDEAGSINVTTNYEVPFEKEMDLIATPNYGYEFVGWYINDDLYSENSTDTYKMDACDINLVAKFKLKKFTISLTNKENIDITGAGSYDYMSFITLSSNIEGNTVAWYIDDELISISNSINIFVDKDINVEAKLSDGYLRDNDNIYFGSYPQTLVTDTVLTKAIGNYIKTLEIDPINFSFSSVFVYFEGKDKTQTKCMKYCDVDINNDGINDYRAIIFTDYRINYDSFTPVQSAYYSLQDDYGYELNTTYYFKYTPLKWDILNEDDDVVTLISNSILDNQMYRYYSSSPTSDLILYYYSDIRNWLNDDFYNLAFNSLEKNIMNIRSITNVDEHNGTVNEGTTFNDYVYLPSYTEILNYSNKNSFLLTDYAKIQNADTLYMTRTNSDYDCQIYYYGPTSGFSYGSTIGFNYKNITTNFGIKPVISINK